MRYLVYLMTLLFVGTAIAQNPTIVQGNYITNVFGNSNFVLNPNALTNVANVTNATRSTTTPLVATSEFTLSLASGANATWTLRAFDGGMKGQNCEARFTYRGFATATTKAEIVQNSLVVASLTLTPTTDPRIASINFPCGDLVNATTFRIAQTTANMTGTNEIGGIYVGLATNMANVAQAEFYGAMSHYGNGSCSWVGAGTSTQISANANCTSFTQEQGASIRPATNIPGIRIVPAKSGNYQIMVNVNSYAPSVGTGQLRLCMLYANGTFVQNMDNSYFASTGNYGIRTTGVANISMTSGTTYDLDLRCDAQTTIFARNTNETNQWTVYRFPSSSELVVTPERQNVFGGVSYAGSSDFSGTSATTANVSASNFSTATFHGKAIANGSATCGGASTDYGFCLENVPAGTYQIAANFEGLIASSVTPASRYCNFSVRVTTAGGTEDPISSIVYATSSTSNSAIVPPVGIIKFTSFQSYVRLNVQYVSGNGDTCIVRSSSSGIAATKPSLQFSPLDQPTNSALYVQGPVKAAGTGAAISSGYQMYSQKVSVAGSFTVTAGTVAIYNTTLPAGKYLTWAQSNYNNGAANLVAWLCVNTANSATSSDDGCGSPSTWATSGGDTPLSSAPFIFESTGSNLLYIRGASFAGAGVGTFNSVRLFYVLLN